MTYEAVPKIDSKKIQLHSAEFASNQSLGQAHKFFTPFSKIRC